MIDHPARRQKTFETAGVTVLLDVGANEGQFAALVRERGFTGRIASVEPVPEAYEALVRARAGDASWTGVHAALGAQAGTLPMTVTTDTRCSSLLPVGAIAGYIPVAAPARTIEVPVERLDALWGGLVRTGDVVALKIDTQGYEVRVLDGLGDRLAEVAVLEVELALLPLYEGGSSLEALLPRLTAAGFGVVSLDDGHVDPATGQVLDVDVLMRRRYAAGSLRRW